MRAREARLCRPLVGTPYRVLWRGPAKEPGDLALRRREYDAGA